MINSNENKVFHVDTPREMFNAALFGVLAQGVPSYDKVVKNCQYEMEDGSARCGVGHCLTIPALQVVKDFNGGVEEMILELSGDDVDEDISEDAQGIDPIVIEFLDTLQSAHDEAESAAQRLDDRRDFVEDFTARMSFLALEYFGHENLDVNVGIPE